MTVCLFKSEKDNDPYRTTFENHGIKVIFEPVLTFGFLNKDKLQHVLFHEFENYGAIISTSSRSLNAISNIMNELEPFAREELIQHWKHKKLYCVGKATSLASPIPFDDIKCASTDAVELSSIILQDLETTNSASKRSSKYLFLCSDIRRDVIPQLANSLDMTELIVYSTKKMNIPSDTKSEESDVWKCNWWVFFSPSGVSSVIDQFQAQNTIENIKLAAIGNTTAQAMMDAGLRVDAVATEPNPSSLFQSMFPDSSTC